MYNKVLRRDRPVNRPGDADPPASRTAPTATPPGPGSRSPSGSPRAPASRSAPSSPSTHPRRARLHHQRRPPRPDPHRSEQGVTQGSPEGSAATAVPGRTMITVILFYAEYLRQIRTQIFRDHASGLPGWRKTRRSGRPWECSLSGVVPCGESRGAVSVVRRPGRIFPTILGLASRLAWQYFRAGHIINGEHAVGRPGPHARGHSLK
jgi:hypothetical protein